MKFSFTTMATPGLSAQEVIQLAVKYGYHGVDIRVGAHKSELALDSSPKEIKELKNLFAMEGILPSSLLCYIELERENQLQWDSMKKDVLRCLNISSELGSPAIRIWLDNPEKFQPQQDYRDRMAEMLADLLEKDKSDVSILVQNHRLRSSAGQAAEMIKRVGSPRLGLAFSPDHCLIMNENVQKIYSESRSMIKQLYMADIRLENSGYRDALPGQGQVALCEAYEACGGKNFDGWVTFKWEKIWHDYLEGPEVALPYFMKYFRNHIIPLSQ